jgi:hypothetical protein
MQLCQLDVWTVLLLLFASVVLQISPVLMEIVLAYLNIINSTLLHAYNVLLDV